MTRDEPPTCAGQGLANGLAAAGQTDAPDTSPGATRW